MGLFANVIADCLPDVSSFMNEKARNLRDRPFILAPVAQRDDTDDFPSLVKVVQRPSVSGYGSLQFNRFISRFHAFFEGQKPK